MTLLSLPTAPDPVLDEAWVDVCGIDELLMDRGAAALIGGHQIALFRLTPGDRLFAISNRDPISGANVMARGLVGSVTDVPTIASPMYKQRFDLRSGRCLDDDQVAVDVFVSRVTNGKVQISLP